MNDKENFDNWLRFLDPENLKESLMFSSLFVALFESFKDYVIDEVKFFYNIGFANGELNFSPEYEDEVMTLDKSQIKATLLWLKSQSAIEENDLSIYDDLRKYRNMLSHEVMTFLFNGLPPELPMKYKQLIELRVKIEKWWILNIEIPTSGNYTADENFREDDIVTSSEMTNRILFDLLSGDEKRASFYRNELYKMQNQ